MLSSSFYHLFMLPGGCFSKMKCNICEKVLSTLYNLHRHEKLVHADANVTVEDGASVDESLNVTADNGASVDDSLSVHSEKESTNPMNQGQILKMRNKLTVDMVVTLFGAIFLNMYLI